MHFMRNATACGNSPPSRVPILATQFFQHFLFAGGLLDSGWLASQLALANSHKLPIYLLASLNKNPI